MKALFDGVPTYQILLSVMGILLFLISLVFMIYGYIKERKIGVWASMVAFSVVPVGWTSISSFKLHVLKQSLEVALTEYVKDNSETNKARLDSLLNQTEEVAFDEPSINKVKAKAYLILGEDQKAATLIGSKLTDTTDSEVKEIKKNVETVKDLRIKFSNAEQNTNDTTLKKQIHKELDELRKTDQIKYIPPDLKRKAIPSVPK